MARLINAPHLADQPHEPYSDLIILAGRKAWQAWNKGKGEEWLLLFELVYGLKPTEKPVILGDKQLDNITGIKLAEPEQQTIKLFQYGELTAAQITAICLNLADNTQVKAVELYDNSAQLKEDLSAYIQRLRSEDRSIANLVVEPAKIKDKSPFSEKAQSFRQWLNLDLALQRGSREIYHYDGKIWAQLDSEDLEEKAVQFFNDSDLGYSIRSIESLIGTLKAQLPRMGDQSSGLLAFNDGMLNRNTLVFEASSREHWLTSLIPVNYQNQAQNTPHFDKWLDFVSEGNADKKHNILAALYAILTNRYNWQMFFEITGVGGSGKSIFAQIATMLAGEENTDTARLVDFDEPRGREPYKDKTLIICPEQSRYGGDGSGLKSISGGDPVTIDPKNKKAFKAIIPAIILIVNNEPTRFTERAGGIERRRVIFAFDKAVPKDKRDPYLIDKLAQEVGGIVHKLLNTFPDPMTAKKALDKQMSSQEALRFKVKADHITAFCGYFYTTEQADGLFIGNARMFNKERTHLYPAYLAFVDANNIKGELNLNNFSEALRQGLDQYKNPFDYQSRRTNQGIRTNVKFKNLDEFFEHFIKRN